MQCAYCALNMSGKSVVLKKGDSIVDTDDACQRYKCIVSLVVFAASTLYYYCGGDLFLSDFLIH